MSEILPDIILRFLHTFSVYQWFALFLNFIGVVFIYINRKSLLYEDQNDRLSLGRVWSWILFYLAISFWARYIIGIIPPSTAFPPCLDDLLYACLLYELFKQCLDKDILKLLLLRKYNLPPDVSTDTGSVTSSVNSQSFYSSQNSVNLSKSNLQNSDSDIKLPKDKG